MGGDPSDEDADRPTAGDWLRGKLAAGPKEVEEIRREAIGDGYSWSTICRAKRRLKVRSWKLVKDHREFYKWRLPRGTWRGMKPEENAEIEQVESGKSVRALDRGEATPASPTRGADRADR